MDEWIVIVTERNVWPAKHGCDARIVQLIKGYQKLGFKVCLVGTHYSTNRQAAHLVDHYILTYGPSWDWKQNINTFDAGWFFGGIMQAMKELNRVVAVQVEYVWMTHALKVVPDEIIKLVDTHDLMNKRAAIYDPHGILPYCRITREQEAAWLRWADVIIAIQDDEAKEFRDMCPDRKVVTVGHWMENIKAYPCDENSNIVMLVGSDNPSNIMAAQKFLSDWHELRNAIPDIELRIYGTLGGKIPDAPGIVKYGFVQNLERAYATAKLVVNPTTLGTGLKIKTVEAMAHGRAVVSTPCGAEGIAGGVCVSRDIIHDITRLLMDSDMRRRLEKSAVEYAKDNFSTEAVFGDVLKVMPDRRNAPAPPRKGCLQADTMNANEHHIRGDDYFHGRNGFEKDARKASEHWLKGAELDNVQCMKNMAWAYRDGIGVTPSPQMSQFWTERHKSIYFSDPDIRQDKWVESVFDGKRDGYFVEIGASDGVSSSNCCMLERRLNWSGICIEPNPDFYAKLCENRNAKCLNCPVAPTERDVEFCLAGYYGGIQDTLSSWHEKEWKGKPKIKMRTRVLADILDEHNAPPVIDYLSLDIEGGEAEIIETFPFDRYRVLTMTVEQSDIKVVDVIKSKGFQIVKNPLSKPHVNWEIHCIHESLI